MLETSKSRARNTHRLIAEAAFRKAVEDCFAGMLTAVLARDGVEGEIYASVLRAHTHMVLRGGPAGHGYWAR